MQRPLPLGHRGYIARNEPGFVSSIFFGSNVSILTQGVQ